MTKTLLSASATMGVGDWSPYNATRSKASPRVDLYPSSVIRCFSMWSHVAIQRYFLSVLERPVPFRVDRYPSSSFTIVVQCLRTSGASLASSGGMEAASSFMRSRTPSRECSSPEMVSISDRDSRTSRTNAGRARDVLEMALLVEKQPMVIDLSMAAAAAQLGQRLFFVVCLCVGV